MRLLAVALIAVTAAAQTPIPTGREVSIRRPSEFEWKPSTNLPPGTEYHLVREDPVTHGVQAIVKFPSGYSLPLHSHDADETLVVLKGKLRVKAGELEQVLSPPGYTALPAGVEHELAVKGFGACWLLITTNGPYTLKKQQ